MPKSNRPDDATLLTGDVPTIAAMCGVTRCTVSKWRSDARKRAGASVYEERAEKSREFMSAYEAAGHNLSETARQMGLTYSGAYNALVRARKLLEEEATDGSHWEPLVLVDPADLTPVRYDDIPNPDIDRRAQLGPATLAGWAWVSRPRLAMRSAA